MTDLQKLQPGVVIGSCSGMIHSREVTNGENPTSDSMARVTAEIIEFNFVVIPNMTGFVHM